MIPKISMHGVGEIIATNKRLPDDCDSGPVPYLEITIINGDGFKALEMILWPADKEELGIKMMAEPKDNVVVANQR
jgi:hypothetical protein